ncbi:ATP-dependent zinc metalloprotease FtsH [Rivularia sp. UHCC 0363]|uniref:ATP-dependent zinc metalloprotease FtsH n=1 Tax=Rivularia sp. UHCC 0363 TaxID=3110244 RepID=UPI002B202125|nr:ATP-dependent zinc metalloprotease FtsH [Rivularia sp. UHCC 0363]MEA5598500.1 ATP-dependent zinc metalloprotease FtsH [Rivularia sp. UHCC 0363]
MKIGKDGYPSPPKQGNVGGCLLTIVLLFLLIGFFPLFNGSSQIEVPYSQFRDRVREGKVSKVKIGENKIEYFLKNDLEQAQKSKSSKSSPEQTYITVPLAQDQSLPKLLEDNNVEFGVKPSNEGNWIFSALSWLLTPLLFFVILAWLANRAQIGGSGANPLNAGKSKARVYIGGASGSDVTFADVAGIDEAKAELQEVVDFLKNPDRYTSLGAKIPKGVLLIGPPGTGKTLLAKAVAGEAGVPFISISGSEFVEMFVGVGAARVRDLFEQAKQLSPCIIFIDELDALGKSRGGSGMFAGSNEEREQTLDQMLTQMDGFEPNTGIIIIAATNRPEILDQALLRPGRFDRQVVVDRPDKLGRLAILQVHTQKVRLSNNIDLSIIAARTIGFAGADLANLINEAALLAARNYRETVTMADFNEAFERLIAGLEKRTRVLNETERTIVAYHESGHAIVGTLVSGQIEKISIVPRGIGALGYTLQLPEEDRFLMLEDEIRARITTLLAGRSAEEVVFGRVSTGASDDIQKATDLAEQAITLYGMSQNLGPIAMEKPQSSFLDGGYNSRRPVSPIVAGAIDREVREMIENAHHQAQLILKTNRDLLEEMAQHLLEHEVLEGDILRSYLSRVKAP